MIKTKTFKSGLRLCIDQNRNSQLVAVSIGVMAGSQNESKKEWGLAHFLEHLFFKSTAFHSSEFLQEQLSGFGAYINANTGENSTHYILKSSKSKISDCLKLYSEMFNNFSFVEKEFENEKKIIFEEMKRAEDDNNMILTRRAHQNALGKSLCSHMTLGTEEIVSKIKIKDVISFKKRLYTQQNTVISFCGNISLRMAKSLIQKYFPTLTKGDQKPNFFTESENLLYPNKTFLPIERDIKQTQVRISIKAANTFDEKRYAVSLYACILGGGMSSRLFKRIREELGLVYSISAFSNRSYKYGYLNIGFSTPAKEVELALKETRKIISDLANNGATEEELQKCKNIFETDFYGEQEKVLSRASTLCKKQMSNHETEDFLKVIKHYKDVTLAQINDIAKQIAAEDVWAITSLGKSKIGELKAFAK